MRSEFYSSMLPLSWCLFLFILGELPSPEPHFIYIGQCLIKVLYVNWDVFDIVCSFYFVLHSARLGA